ncbi:hypothetical protein CALCODRAFT_196165 [Calocera cornea HHB12733]|uniref:F-box domain-containing protein n=1 Tax=Calocera cornea HHB12733 TaxID=1353952 RepID=A0A165HK46_9BASI|nr:hypothetical protein CALCODRAFT_196165 [Calocera cornea HHB12733]
MHRALCLEEVLQNVLEEVDFSALPLIARTCQRFFQPAAGLLYRDMDTIRFARLIEPILALCEEQSDAENVSLSVITDNPAWKRLSVYSICVRSLTLLFYLEDPIERHLSTLVEILQKSNPTFSIFPRLRALVYITQRSPHLRSVTGFLAPSLEGFQLLLHDTEFQPTSIVHWTTRFRVQHIRELDRVLLRVRERCPGLKQLALEFPYYPDAQHQDTLVRIISSLDGLVSLRCGHPGDGSRLLTAISRLPNLCKLALGLEDNELNEIVPIEYGGPGEALRFTMLRSLTLSSTPAVATDVITKLNLDLRELILRSGGESFDLQDIHRFIAAAGGHTALSRFHVRLYEASRSGPPLSWSAMAPLLGCRQMKHFIFNWWSSAALELNDQHIADMAAAWPNLRQFSLSWSLKRERMGGLVDETAVTFDSAVALAIHCRALQELRLAQLIPATTKDLSGIEPALQHIEYVVDYLMGHVYDSDSLVTTLWPNAETIYFDMQTG